MEAILQGILYTCVYNDDILVTRCTEEEDLQNLDMVLTWLEEAVFCLKQEKFQFLLPEVDYFGHVLSAKGLQLSQKMFKLLKQY